MFLHVSVILSTGGSTWAGTPRAVTPPWESTPPPAGMPPLEQCMLGDMGNKRAVRILLECILVLEKIICGVKN